MTIAQVSQKYQLSPDTLRYYEKVGMIPPVNRTPSGLRDYTPQNCRWVELAKCMRSAGLPVEMMVDYVRLFMQGDETIAERLELLVAQRERLLAQRADIDRMLEKLDSKIERYKVGVRLGKLPER